MGFACAELKALQQDCDPTNPLADLAVLELSLADPNPLFAPIKAPQTEEPQTAAVPAAAKGSAKAPAAKAPAVKAPAAGKAAAAAAAAPPSGAPELGRALELLGQQVGPPAGTPCGVHVISIVHMCYPAA